MPFWNNQKNKYFFKITKKYEKKTDLEWMFFWNEMELFGRTLNYLELKWMKRNVHLECPFFRNVPLHREKKGGAIHEANTKWGPQTL